MESIPYFHLGIVAACLTYYFKLSEIKLDFFEECYKAFREIKSQMTGEISKEIDSLATPLPSVIISTTDGPLEYREGIANPTRSEKFKNWLDSYLDKNLSAIMTYHKFTLLYKKWTRRWSFLKKFSIYFSIYEFVLAAFSFYLVYSIKNNEFQFKLFSNDISFIVLCCFSFVSIMLVVLSLFLLAYTESLKSQLIKSRDHHNGL